MSKFNTAIEYKGQLVLCYGRFTPGAHIDVICKDQANDFTYEPPQTEFGMEPEQATQALADRPHNWTQAVRELVDHHNCDDLDELHII